MDSLPLIVEWNNEWAVVRGALFAYLQSAPELREIRLSWGKPISFGLDDPPHYASPEIFNFVTFQRAQCYINGMGPYPAWKLIDNPIGTRDEFVIRHLVSQYEKNATPITQ